MMRLTLHVDCCNSPAWECPTCGVVLEVGNHGNKPPGAPEGNLSSDFEAWGEANPIPCPWCDAGCPA